ncbi:MAG TPA: hypothetical protein DC047_14390 [Blastocatellia bacterium]|nr:hypothetical protein [Blastocatellia bacterium]
MSPKSIGGGARQERKPLTLETEAQQVLNELWREKLIPFQLNVGRLTKEEASGNFTIHFHDSRIYSAGVTITQGQKWAEMVRAAVLARVTRISGPLRQIPWLAVESGVCVLPHRPRSNAWPTLTP